MTTYNLPLTTATTGAANADWWLVSFSYLVRLSQCALRKSAALGLCLRWACPKASAPRLCVKSTALLSR